MSVIVSLFDESGNAVRPWAEAGYVCYCFDLVNKGDREVFPSGGCIVKLYADLTEAESIRRIIALKPVLVMGFPDCTHLAVSGAKHFFDKAIADPEFQVKAVALCRVVETVGNACGCPWVLENPVSMLASLWRKPDFYFHPNEYGGYLPEDDKHPRWPQYIPPRDAYTKKTCLWSGGGWRMPPKRRVDPIIIRYDNGVSGSPAFAKLGGKSAKTKQIRAETPRGFSIANYKNMSWYVDKPLNVA